MLRLFIFQKRVLQHLQNIRCGSWLCGYCGNQFQHRRNKRFIRRYPHCFGFGLHRHRKYSQQKNGIGQFTVLADGHFTAFGRNRTDAARARKRHFISISASGAANVKRKAFRLTDVLARRAFRTAKKFPLTACSRYCLRIKPSMSIWAAA